ncbi:MAG: hypothetical protein BMS9Abin29_0173 [Gemmatimonadota bacterium]|nr:MAG: hypothetical protein BMS9Abin29_0173 [Gemmatimonadota bacterium]
MGLAVALDTGVDELAPAPLSKTGWVVVGILGFFAVGEIILLILADDVNDALGN